MTWNKSRFKANEERICYSLDDFIKLFEGITLEYVDGERDDNPYWQNDGDTIVFRVKSQQDVHFAYALARLRPHEVDYIEDGTDYCVFRLWWD